MHRLESTTTAAAGTIPELAPVNAPVRELLQELGSCIQFRASHGYFPPQQTHTATAALEELSKKSPSDVTGIFATNHYPGRRSALSFGDHLAHYALLVPDSVNLPDMALYRSARQHIITSFERTAGASLQLERETMSLLKNSLEEPVPAHHVISAVEIAVQLKKDDAERVLARMLECEKLFPFAVYASILSAADKFGPKASWQLLKTVESCCAQHEKTNWETFRAWLFPDYVLGQICKKHHMFKLCQRLSETVHGTAR